MTFKAKNAEEIAAAYDAPPSWYDIRGFFILKFAYNSSLTDQIRFFGKNISPKHLEVACGSGSLLRLLLLWRKMKGLAEGEITGIDYAESMLAGAIRTFRNNKDITLRHADAASLPFVDNEFSSANIANALHCFPDYTAALDEIHRVLKPDGLLAVNALLYPDTETLRGRLARKTNNWGINKGILVSPFKQEEIRAALLARFDLVEEYVTGNAYNMLLKKRSA